MTDFNNKQIRMKKNLSEWLSLFSVKRILRGRTYTQLLIAHFGEIILTVVLCVLLIHNQYKCNETVSKISKCDRELNNNKYEALTKKSQLTKKIQQSNIKRLVDEKGLQLVESTYPPYVLEK